MTQSKVDQAIEQVRQALQNLEQAQSGQQQTTRGTGASGIAEAERRYGKPAAAAPETAAPAPTENAKGHAEAARRFGKRAGGGTAA